MAAAIAAARAIAATSGGTISVVYNWKLDVPAEWKLKPGQAWKDATESIRPEEEIDPSKKEKANR